MSIIVKRPENAGVDLLAPDGLQAAVCCDVEDLGDVVNERYNNVSHKIKLHFLLAETIPTQYRHPQTGENIEVPEFLVGRPYGVGRRFTASLHEKATLRQFLKTWRGKDFTSAELEGFDLENLVGVPAALNIVHNYSETSDRWFANIEGISKLPVAWDAPKIPDDYVRRKDREDKGTDDGTPTVNERSGNTQAFGPGPDTTDDPIPESVAEGFEPDDDLPF